MSTVTIRLGSQGPFKSSLGRGITCDKVPTDPNDMVRLTDLVAAMGFHQVNVAGQGSLVADADGQTLTLEGCTGLAITTDSETDTLTLTLQFGSGSGQVCEGNDPRLADARAPLAHAASHAPDGSDPVAFYFVD